MKSLSKRNDSHPRKPTNNSLHDFGSKVLIISEGRKRTCEGTSSIVEGKRLVAGYGWDRCISRIACMLDGAVYRVIVWMEREPRRVREDWIGDVARVDTGVIERQIRGYGSKTRLEP